MDNTPSYSTYVKAQHKTKQLAAVYTLCILILLISSMLAMVLIINRGQLDLLSLLVAQVIYLVIFHSYLISSIIQAKEDPTSLDAKLRYLKDQPLQLTTIQQVLLVIFTITGMLQIFFLNFLIMGIIRDLAVILLIGQHLFSYRNAYEQQFHQGRRYIYTYQKANLLGLGLMAIVFEYIYYQQLITIAFFTLLQFIGFGLFIVLLFYISNWQEAETINYIAFSRYEEQFNTVGPVRSRSFSGFMATIPKKLASLRYSINILYVLVMSMLIIISLAFLSTGVWTALLGINLWTGYILLLFFSFPIILLIWLIIRSRTQVFDIMELYSQTMQAFEQRNSRILSSLDEYTDEE